MHRAPAVLIAAASGRALAASARRGGYAPLVADFFGDEDTATAAEAYIRLDHGLADGMRYDRVITALERLATRREPAGIVCGTGFEDRPELLSAIARRWTLFGNNPPQSHARKSRSLLQNSAMSAASRIPIPPSLGPRIRDECEAKYLYEKVYCARGERAIPAALRSRRPIGPPEGQADVVCLDW